jgi:integrase
MQEKLAAGEAWEDSGYVATDELGAPMHPHAFLHRFETVVETAGVPMIRPHDMRHTCATVALAACLPAKVVQEMLANPRSRTPSTSTRTSCPGCRGRRPPRSAP